MFSVICTVCRSVGYTASPHYVRCECGGGLIPHLTKLKLLPRTKKANEEKSIFIPQKGRLQEN